MELNADVVDGCRGMTTMDEVRGGRAKKVERRRNLTGGRQRRGRSCGTGFPGIFGPPTSSLLWLGQLVRNTHSYLLRQTDTEDQSSSVYISTSVANEVNSRPVRKEVDKPHRVPQQPRPRNDFHSFEKSQAAIPALRVISHTSISFTA